MRVVGGQFRGRALATPQHEGLRPTSDRVRESVFNILAHGIEGLSRGASYCLFVEEAAEARALIRTNIEAMGLMGVTRIFRRDATDIGPAGKLDAYGLAFLDPPYGKGLGEKALIALRDGKWLAPGALVVLEEREGTVVSLPEGFEELDRRSWGDTQVIFARAAAG